VHGEGRLLFRLASFRRFRVTLIGKGEPFSSVLSAGEQQGLEEGRVLCNEPQYTMRKGERCVPCDGPHAML
jgi:hypothetical protein